jgi:pyridoxine 4-dehydrogenase
MASIIDKAKSTLGLDKKDISLVGKPIHDLGFGLMGLTWRKNPVSQEQAFATMKAALASGANFWNGGEIYGNSSRNSLHLLQEYFDKYPEDREKVVISIKGGCVKDELKPDGSADNTKRSIQECIDVLGKSGKKLDIWESARVDPGTPIEVTVRAAKEFVDAGKIGGIGLSECSAETIRRAAAVTKIAAVEVEFSLWATEIEENGVADTCAELGIPIVAYSPLGRGFLTGQIRKFEDLPEDDLRRHMPRFAPDNFPKNLKLVEELETIGKRKGCTSGQVGISWIKAKSATGGLPTIIPIPGATTVERVKENFHTVDLGENDVKEIDSLLAGFEIAGGRYPEHMAGLLFGNSPPLKE